MRAVDVIAKKRNGKPLSGDEIEFFINGYVSGAIPDYQMAAFLMAVYFNGLNFEETFELTISMLNTGNSIDLSDIEGIKVDKHSTGGVGDKTTLVVAPLAAASGVPVPKMSGHGLGYTGGTLDKLSSIPGFKTGLTIEEFRDTVKKVGIAVTGQSEDFVPADKKIYELRDVTATVENLSLIASSIMSKKLATGNDAILLDVKAGSGAFMKTGEGAVSLAEIMVKIGKKFGKKVKAYITDMSQPLGNTIGNAIEVEEAINTLKDMGPEDFTELCISLGGEMLVLGGKAENTVQGKDLARKNLKNGLALEKFGQWIAAQGGDPEIIYDLSVLPRAKYSYDVVSKAEGYISVIDAGLIGMYAMQLGAGRETKGQKIDLLAGIRLLKKVGDRCSSGEAIATAYSSFKNKLEEFGPKLINAFKLSPAPPHKNPLIRSIIE